MRSNARTMHESDHIGHARAAAVTAGLLLASTLLHGQRGITDAITPPAVEQGATAGSYALSGFESVNPFSGRLHFALPLLTVGGRGEAGYTMMLTLDRGWQVQALLDGNGDPVSYYALTNQQADSHWWSDSAVPLFSPGRMVSRRSGSNRIQCEGTSGQYGYGTVLTRLTFIAADGSETEFVDKPSGGNPALIGQCVWPQWTRPGPFVSRDGTAMTFVPNAPIVEDQDPDPGHAQGAPSGTLYFRDGRRYLIQTGFVTAIVDRNGNTTTLAYDQYGRLASVTDPLGRTITINQNLPGGGAEISWMRSVSLTRSLKIRYGQMNTVLAAGQTVKTYAELFDAYGGSSYLFDPQVVTSVELPDGRQYSFKYNSYGELAEVTLPTGGAYRYEWTGTVVYNGGKPFVVRRVTRREIFAEGQVSAGGSLYAYESGTVQVDGRSYPFTKTTETPFGIGVSGTRVHYSFGHAEQPDQEQGYDIPQTYWRQGKEYQSQVFGPSSNLMMTTVQTWAQRPCEAGEACPSTFVQIDPRVTERIETLNDTGASVKTVTAYDRFNNPIEVAEYDVPPGGGQTLVRRVTTGYETAAGYVEAPAHLRSLVRVREVYGSVLAEKTETLYDEQTPADNPGMTGYTAPATSARGNATSIRQYVDLPAPKWLATTRTFDAAGNVRAITDPRGKTWTVSYSSATAYAFPSEITNPLGHTITMNWDFYLGRLLSKTGPNSGETTSYEYSTQDALDRLSRVVRPVGSTTFEYNDAARTRTARTAQNSCGLSQSEDLTEEFDGLGRLIRSIQTEDASQIEVRTEYDGLGRKRRVSFPYRGAATGWTEIEYDALGRQTVERVIAGSTPAVTTFSYSGRTTTVTDAAGKFRELSYDAVGRLVRVREAGQTQTEANYTYDGAGRLTGVAHAGQTRTFLYDTAGRLLSATNPESGTITYAYDDAGNLVERIDARGIRTCMGYQPGTGCTASAMAHDGLNRVVKKTYGDATPEVSYTYDTCANGLGRLCVVSAKAQGAASPFASVSYGYDVAGRIISSTQTTDSVAYPFSYTYDLTGKVEAMTLPSGRTVTSCYDRAGRMKSVTGVKAGESARSYVSQASYDSGGGLDRALLGNGRWEDWDYNERKQVVSIKLGSTQGAGDLLTLGFGYGTTDNNGNVLSQTIARPGFSATQTYTYDAYNRIQKVQEGTESRDFAYKEPGNLYVPSWSTGTGWAPGSFTPASPSWFDGNNRLVNTLLGIQYDAAGNLTAIGGFTFAYDAENRLVSSTLNSVTTNYVYDGEGRRVKKGSVVMVYDAFGRLAAEYGGTADPVGTEYLTADHLGSTRLVTSSTGAERRCLDYLPFGEQMTQGMGGRGACYASATEPRVKFTGKERDVETGLDFFQARYYSGAQGRFTSPDPENAGSNAVDPQSWNMYAYGRNNPLKYVDPDGLAYRVCEVNSEGKEFNCGVVESDKAFEKYAKDQGWYTKGGKLYNSEGAQIGTASWFDLEQQRSDIAGAQFIYNQVGPPVKALAAATLTFVGGAGVIGAGGAVAGAGLTTVNLQGAAQAAALTLPAGAKLAQMIARGGGQFAGNPAGFLSYAREFVANAVRQGTYTVANWIGGNGATIYRNGNDYMVVARDGKILSYVPNATPGTGVVSTYLQMGGK
jgi:RHS repeat-associated protein